MPVAYVLQPPNLVTTILFPVTFVLSGCTLVTKEGGALIPHWREFATAEAARAHLDDVIRARKGVRYILVEHGRLRKKSLSSNSARTSPSCSMLRGAE